MTQLEIKSFDKPDETRAFEGKGMADIVMVLGRPVARGHFEPGWRWSVNVKPIAQTNLCEVSHFGYVEQGRMRISMADGSEQDISAGQIAAIPAGHDAEVVGNEACIFIDFGDVSDYARQK
ncbi:MAG TPA: cupin domain-containing protein [Micromonosporaceae bacterium]